ncbi:MAG: sel1 repeat family protein [Alphaproteobacteria bacterium]|nr:sel1 repeat family protein [Alphaproteobacteria bacterium]
MPEGPEPGKGHRRGQEDAGGARHLRRLAALAAAGLWTLAPAAGAAPRPAPHPAAKHAAPAAKAPPARSALDILKLAAGAGDATAQARLGDDYLLGREGVEKDMVQARAWYAKAAAQGQPDAAFVLGEIYWNGDGVAKDDGEAARWWKVAYDNGRTDAAKLLGDAAFDRARGPNGAWDVTALHDALAWYRKAAAVAGPELQAEAQARVQMVQRLLEAAKVDAG